MMSLWMKEMSLNEGDRWLKENKRDGCGWKGWTWGDLYKKCEKKIMSEEIYYL